MNLSCPTCGFRAAIEVFAGDIAAKRFALLMGRLPPPLAPAVMRYLALFAPAKHAMTFAKGERVLGELLPMIEAGRITRAKREWIVNLEQWEAGLVAMNDKRAALTLPLKSHGYLLEVLAGAADKIEAVAEAADIASDRTGETRKDVGSEAAVWDQNRDDRAREMRAMTALSLELASLKKFQIVATREQLATKLLEGGHTRAAVDAAIARLLKD